MNPRIPIGMMSPFDMAWSVLKSASTDSILKLRRIREDGSEIGPHELQALFQRVHQLDAMFEQTGNPEFKQQADELAQMLEGAVTRGAENFYGPFDMTGVEEAPIMPAFSTQTAEPVDVDTGAMATMPHQQSVGVKQPEQEPEY
tara:strand:+ start:3990 stop:4421 length:432 start_codon:yes stop_codon:yes gene_type:complete